MFHDTKLFIVVRADIPAGHQLVQTALALTSYASDHPLTFLRWFLGGRNLVVLSVKDSDELYEAHRAALRVDKSTTSHFEHCRDGKHLKAIGPYGFTAFVTQARRTTQKIPLALRASATSPERP
jgi:hypothetical protein